MDSKELRGLYEAYQQVNAPQQIDELSVNKMHAYINKAEKDRDSLNKKWDQGTATPKERKKVFDREEGEARASKKIKQKTGKDSFRLNALDKLKSAVTKEELDIFDVVLEFLQAEGYAETLEEAEWMMANMIDEEAIDIILGEDSRRMSNKQKTASVRQNIKAFGSNFTPPNNYDPDANRGKGEVLTRKQIEKKRRKALRQEDVEFVDEAQEARNNPEKYEREQSKKTAPVRGERTPMPPRGDKRREDFEKWYAKQMGR